MEAADTTEVLAALTSAERVLCGPLILRRLRANTPRTQLVLQQVGLDASILLFSAEALMKFYAPLLGLAAFAVVIASIHSLEAPLLVFCILVATAGGLRFITFSRAKRRYRRVHPEVPPIWSERR
jgi:Flp pilus assembly protein TadB